MKKALSVLCAAMMLLANTAFISASADYAPVNVVAPSDADIQATGLIYGYNIQVSNYNSMLCVNGHTTASGEMSSVGFKDIQIWQSSDNQNWKKYDYKISDVLETDAYSCSMSNRLFSVDTGYYYRVTCTHYAKATGLFGSSQSVSNTSNSVKIS